MLAPAGERVSNDWRTTQQATAPHSPQRSAAAAAAAAAAGPAAGPAVASVVAAPAAEAPCGAWPVLPVATAAGVDRVADVPAVAAATALGATALPPPPPAAALKASTVSRCTKHSSSVDSSRDHCVVVDGSTAHSRWPPWTVRGGPGAGPWCGPWCGPPSACGCGCGSCCGGADGRGAEGWGLSSSRMDGAVEGQHKSCSRGRTWGQRREAQAVASGERGDAAWVGPCACQGAQSQGAVCRPSRGRSCQSVRRALPAQLHPR